MPAYGTPAEGRLGDTAAADQLVRADAVDLDREGVGEPPPGRGLVVQQRVHGLDRGDQPRLGGGPVHQVLREPEVLAHRPAALAVVVQGLLGGHAAGQAGDLLQGAAGAHPQTAAGDTAHQPVDDQEALPAGEVVGPGEGQQGAGHAKSFAGY
ncbi:hypothetical protein GCM10010383_27430 [Streptomyces lomondensis]|uniref:Uncharacterized protein n=1 Tax=Streptomyces lomondensis TaxID=68229 RepID=A0ABQ2X325_9ACTN|nr:hypothetical protein GCM10010383_27430 [Streptomyces lomondensis]